MSSKLKLKLYEGIEIIMHTIAAASVAISCESIVQSVVSIYENRQNKFRTITDDRANFEMQIGVNGPNLSQADILLENTLDKYFPEHKKGKWHFTMDSTKIAYVISKTVDSLKNKPSKLSFMDTYILSMSKFYRILTHMFLGKMAPRHDPRADPKK